MKRFNFFVALLSILSVVNTFGHALWIETNSTGQKGQKQTVKIIYSEPDEAPEKVGDWYSDVKEFELWLIGPDQQKTKLNVTPAQDYFAAEFTPQQEGVYTLAIGHGAKDLGGTTKYQFNATAIVTVGKTNATSTVHPNELNVAETQFGKEYKVGKAISLAGFFKEKPSEKLRIEISSPSGWNRAIQTNAEGVAEFTPLWPGVYKIEASKTEKTTGEQNGKPYQAVWRCATYVLNVGK
ncbi:DUF4198 domain-containing protein [Spirosoma sp. BT702]|uniref:DUF4198 domain-containing protein n=1 Tax=Spirosoma profusum TaxID=2771354 RepID=A0A926Y3C5_9BACT|nr:DUF4198 domain-containing protein [Spirosoma profusum]MBD2703922.1 DUF4198 domain-containing protein [Spirosoma profusum]